MVTRPWPEEVERVATFLRSAGAEARVEEFESGTPTAEDAARAVGCELGQIVKSLVFVCDARPVLVMVPGDRRADREKIRQAAGSGYARIAGTEEVKDATGFEPGAVAPFPLPSVQQVFIERTLLQHKTVWIGAGSPNHMAALGPGELQRLGRAKPIDAVDEAA
jgi:prolyl-tRNA editing enzyme YbaK/EbsC (Cys-tRNA(Pro) deacylase)